jgi:predicted permease
MDNFLHDLRFAFRMLFKSPLFTAAAVFTLALGIGLNAAVFSAVHAVLFRPLPGVRQDSELVQLYRSWPGDMVYGSNSIPHYQDLRDRVEAFEGKVASWTFVTLSLSAEGRNQRILGNMVSANFFDVLGARMALGRGFTKDESTGPGAHPVVVLGHSFWQTRFGSDPSVMGRSISINNRPFTVVGVAAEEFQGAMPLVDPPVYAPLMMQRELIPGFDLIEARGNNWLNVVARMAPGVTVERARENLDAFILQMREEYPDHYEDSGIHLVPQREAGIHPIFRASQVGMSAVTMAVVAFLLLIACINVANLFLARASERRKEMGIRLSLGARRGRIVSQLLTESVLFAAVAGAAGLGLAYGAIAIGNSLSLPLDFPVDFDLRLDRNVLLFTAALALATGIVFGLAPALQASKPEFVSALKGEASLELAGRSRSGAVLVVAQTTLSIVLLIGSGLFLRGLQAATALDKGFESDNLLLASVDPGLQGYDRERAEVFYREIEAGLEALPGVRAVGLAARVPLTFSSSDRGVSIPGYEPAPNEGMSIRYNSATPGYFEAMGIPLHAGRGFGDEDTREGRPVIVVNQHMADRFWPGESAIGKIVETAGSEWEVVGVVKTGKYQSLGEDPLDFMYFPHAQLWSFPMTVHLRTEGDPSALARLVRREVERLDPAMPVADLRTMNNQLGIALFPARLGGVTLGIFGILGMILAAVGIYSVMAYSVSRRRREIGIRVALGADRSRVVRMVLWKGMRLVGTGVVLGLGAAIFVSRFAQSFLYGVSSLDPVTFLGIPALLCAVAGLANFLPARRAASVDPMSALRAD